MASPPSLLSQITIDATNNKIDLDDGAGEDTATLESKTYNDIWELCAEIQVKVRALPGAIYVTAQVGPIFTESIPGLIKFRFDNNVDILWNTGTNTAVSCGTVIGADITADSGAATINIMDFQHMFGWYSLRYPHHYGPLKPKFIGGESATALSGKNDKVVKIGFHYFYVVDLVMMVPEIVLETSAVGANINRDFVTVWKDAIAKNAVRWREDRTVSGTYHTLYLQEPRSLEDLVRAFDDYEAYDLRLKFRRKEV